MSLVYDLLQLPYRKFPARQNIRLANRYGGARKDHKSGTLKEVQLDWQQKNETLYKLAAEVAKKVGTTFIEGRGKTAAPKKKK